MILLMDTSTPVCKLSLIEGDTRYDESWQADRQLAKGLLAFLHDQLEARGKTFQDIAGIGVFTGPGSFTGLRIGLTVLNTLADAENIPIVGCNGDDWERVALTRLNAGENDRIALPFYGSDAHITTPRK
jgi:tRNA threonylcarbamoyladenosine biosynthesis protein TsaB